MKHVLLATTALAIPFRSSFWRASKQRRLWWRFDNSSGIDLNVSACLNVGADDFGGGKLPDYADKKCSNLMTHLAKNCGNAASFFGHDRDHIRYRRGCDNSLALGVLCLLSVQTLMIEMMRQLVMGELRHHSQITSMTM